MNKKKSEKLVSCRVPKKSSNNAKKEDTVEISRANQFNIAQRPLGFLRRSLIEDEDNCLSRL